MNKARHLLSGETRDVVDDRDHAAKKKCAGRGECRQAVLRLAADRRRARSAAGGLTLTLRRIAMTAARNDFSEAERAYADYPGQVTIVAADLKQAESWSLLNPTVRTAHFNALAQLTELAGVARLPECQ